MSASDLQASQAATFKPWANQELIELAQQRDAVTEAIDALPMQGAGQKRIDIPFHIALPSGKKLVLNHGMTGSDAMDRIFKTLSLEDANANLILSWTSKDFPLIADGLWPRKLDAVIRSLETERRLLHSTYDELSARVQTLDTKHPHVWYYLDFICFSTITQGTVGYGDILPNSTLVRCLVAVQILLGYLVLVVVVNWVIKPPRSTRRKQSYYYNDDMLC